jgi:hypothetical protein
MANKRVPELVAITAAEMSPQDLLLLADVAPFPESKKLPLSELSVYLLNNGNLTGSFYGTSSWAINAISASWAPYQESASYASTSSWAWRSITSSYAIDALSASYALSSSYAITASYAITSSVQLIYSSAFADYARSASYLIYTPGVFNGTASYALTSSRSITSVSSSFLTYSPLTPNGTASFAATASQAISSLFLSFNGNNNGTASHAMTAGNADTVTLVTTIKNDYVYREFGMFQCELINSDTTASIGAFDADSDANNPSIIIEAWGDVIMWSTSSFVDSGSLSLNLVNVDLPVYIELDKSTFLNYNTGSTSAQVTSSIIVPVYLKGKTTSMGHFSASVFKMGSLISFYTGSRPFLMSVKVNSDDFAMDV